MNSSSYTQTKKTSMNIASGFLFGGRAYVTMMGMITSAHTEAPPAGACLRKGLHIYVVMAVIRLL